MCMGILYLQRCCCYLDLNLANRHQFKLALIRRYQGLFLQIRSIDPKAKVLQPLLPQRQLQQQLMQLLQLHGQLRLKRQLELLLGQQLQQLQQPQLTHVQLLPQLRFSIFLPLQQRPTLPLSLIFQIQLVRPQFLTSQLLRQQLPQPLSSFSRLLQRLGQSMWSILPRLNHPDQSLTWFCRGNVLEPTLIRMETDILTNRYRAKAFLLTISGTASLLTISLMFVRSMLAIVI